MSLIVAVPCAVGVILASDSRSVVNDRVVDSSPKITVCGDVAYATTGEIARGHNFAPGRVASAYWRSVGYRLTEDTLGELGRQLATHFREGWCREFDEDDARDGVPLSRAFICLAVTATDDERIIGSCAVSVNRDDAEVDFFRLTSGDLFIARVAGRPIPPANVQPIPVGKVSAASAAGLALNVLLEQALADLYVGGALEVVLVRPVPQPLRWHQESHADRA